MRTSATLFFQGLTALAALAVLTAILWEPHVEGRNDGKAFFEVYANDPFLMVAYIASIAIFVGLYQAFKLLGYIRQNEWASPRSAKALRIIRYCAVTFMAFVLAGEVYLFTVVRGTDDIAGGVFIGGVLFLFSIITATTAAVLERKVSRAVR